MPGCAARGVTRPRRHRHPRPDACASATAAPPNGVHRLPRRRPLRPRRPPGPGRRPGPAWSAWTWPRSFPAPRAYEWDETEWSMARAAPASQTAPTAPRRRHRLRRQAQHPALPGRQRLPRHRGSGHRHHRGHPAPQARRRVSLQRPRRPRRHRRIRGADPAAASWRPACRSSASASATSCSRWPWAPAPTSWSSGHHGANQPVKELATGRVEITSQNHGFAVDDASLPDGVSVTHRQPVRRQQRGHRMPRPPRLQRAVPPRGEPPAPPTAAICSNASSPMMEG